MTDDLTAKSARERLTYDPDTGVLRWKVSTRNRVKADNVAGYKNSAGYLVITIDQKIYRAHRLAWLIVYGKWPLKQLDHINGIKDDNRLVNLRCATPRQNGHNQKCHRAGHLLGTTCTNKRTRNPWKAQINVNGKKTYLGWFATQQQAHEAYMRALSALTMGKTP